MQSGSIVTLDHRHRERSSIISYHQVRGDNDDAFRGGSGVLDLNDDFNVDIISIKNKMGAAKIDHPLLMIILIKVTFFNGTN